MAEELWCAIDRMKVGAIDHHDPLNPVGYVAMCLRGRLRKFVFGEIEHNIRYCDQGKQKRRKSSEFTLDELAEILDACINTEREREVIQLRIEGLKDEEIGKQLGCSKQAVHEVRSRIRDRFLEYYEKFR
jgi:RNA polymerase sigma factor (sigma-70 family)